ncbi:winged helix-turn-helix domain-containing protein [Thermogutta sp.]|uniref:winged helix-turn-helix domain-containing protein n=1 Tax=Thermogutta sp. TaxID=1962930 RepID=UPI003C7C86D1
MDTNEVGVAFEILLEEIEQVIDIAEKESKELLKRDTYDDARALIEWQIRVTDFRGKVRQLQAEWNRLARSEQPRRETERRQSRRLPKGLRTPEDAFRRPILEALVELKGRAPMQDVLQRVEEELKHKLNPYDYEPLPSDPNSVRWRKTAQWCRKTLVTEGLMRADSARGIWEISDKGRAALDRGEV